MAREISGDDHNPLFTLLAERTMGTSTGQTIGSVVPDLSLPAVDTGAMQSLDACLAGRRGGVVLFWSSVCAHCVRYDAYFNQFQDAHPELAFYVVATRYSETLDEIRQAVSDRGLRFPLHHSPDGAAAAAYFAQQTPRVYLVDPQRTLQYRGAVDNFKYRDDPEYEPYLERAIASVLAGAPVERPETSSFGCAVRSVYYDLPKMIERPSSRG
jgi:thiol-disulfide isomerase/thioredoxin